MIQFSKKVLSNGLRVVVHEDKTTPLVAVNVLYEVGSKDEDKDKTGFAHLFEHLMFGGTKNVPDFDHVIQNAGGENNAFTNNDITNFYDLIPAENLEVVLWLEADRMGSSDFTQRVLDVQKKVVIEEFKETCYNEPYGDIWHHLAPMVYKDHPYSWPTIGKNFEHIADAKLEDVNSFHKKFYSPNNAIISISGNVGVEQAFDLVEKWFGDIENRPVKRPMYAIDSSHYVGSKKMIEANVPLDMIILAFPMVGRLDKRYYSVDLLSDILGNGRSSRLYRRLIQDENYCNSIDAFITGTYDPGMLVVEARLNSHSDIEMVEKIIWEELDDLKNRDLSERELQKIKNKAETNLIFSETSTLNKAMSLGYYEYLGDLDLINNEVKEYSKISVEDIRQSSIDTLNDTQVSQLTYKKN